MAGCRKFSLELISRRDIASLTPRAAKVTGIPLIEDAQRDLFERILEF